MRTLDFTNEAELETDSQDENQPLRVAIVYSDVAAGKRAMRVMGHWGRGLGDEIEVQPLPWSYDLVVDPEWGKVAAHDAVRADIFIIATTSANPLPSTVRRWIDEVIQSKRGTAAAVIVLFGSGEDSAWADSSQLEGIEAATQRAGLDFIVPTRSHEPGLSASGIHRRSELATPLGGETGYQNVRGLRWGINE